MKVEGANILVTGASSGIGADLAVRLAQRGATVGLVARRADRLAQVLAECTPHSPASRVWVADLGDLAAAEQVAVDAWDTWGHVDVLVNNAAVPKRRSVIELTNDEIDEIMRIDFTSPVRMSMALLPKMLARGDNGEGMIVNVSSLGGRLGIVHEAAYCAAKFALCGWSESMFMDLRHHGVDVRLIIPGAIDTEIWDHEGSEAPLYDGEKEPPSVVASGIVEAIEAGADGHFEWYLPDMLGIAEFKTSNIDLFLEGAGAMADPKPEET